MCSIFSFAELDNWIWLHDLASTWQLFAVVISEHFQLRIVQKSRQQLLAVSIDLDDCVFHLGWHLSNTVNELQVEVNLDQIQFTQELFYRTSIAARVMLQPFHRQTVQENDT
ncbi:hypothetical protein MUK42_12279 [Musa troglodytarum]|uniref:Uncharacterized protein n=1 Tax=Musa troglodytarum TaxID=320322 RepID=A0A9E7HG94_9LILI|nr:hypothetical protein MUK42_12279 [Musa troglodytarum]